MDNRIEDNSVSFVVQPNIHTHKHTHPSYLVFVGVRQIHVKARKLKLQEIEQLGRIPDSSSSDFLLIIFIVLSISFI